MDVAVHRERSSKQCDDGTQVRPRASSELDGLKKLFIFLPSALFIIALNRRVEKKGMEKAKRNRVCTSLSFRRLPAEPGFLSLPPLLFPCTSLPLSLSLSFSSFLYLSSIAVSVAPCVTDACLNVASRWMGLVIARLIFQGFLRVSTWKSPRFSPVKRASRRPSRRTPPRFLFLLFTAISFFLRRCLRCTDESSKAETLAPRRVASEASERARRSRPSPPLSCPALLSFTFPLPSPPLSSQLNFGYRTIFREILGSRRERG